MPRVTTTFNAQSRSRRCGLRILSVDAFAVYRFPVESIVFCGIQGSGKSEFYRQRFFHTHLRISLDLLKSRKREARFLEVCFETGQPFVVDNTNPGVEDRKRYLDLAKARGYRTVCYFFDTDLALALERNESRPGGERIPKVGIFATRKRLQIPTVAEGFDQLFIVKPLTTSFEVMEVTKTA